MKFLWMSNAPWAGTGYGQQSKLLLSALKDWGHSPECFAFYGLSGGAVEYDGYKVWPNSDYDAWGNDVIKLHIERSGSKAVVTLMDLFVLDERVWSELKVPWVAWVPLDAVGIGKVTLDRLKVVDFPVAMSHFGAEQMHNHGVEPVATIYHAVDTDVFKPGNKAESRAVLGIPEDQYVVGMVMANKGDRKQYPAQLQAVKQWADKNPDIPIRVYIHTEPTAALGGWDMRELVKTIGLSGHVYSTNQYDTSVVPAHPQLMAHIYNAMDVLMNCSAGEGFGIPIVEAQACGIPVITQDVTAMSEITQNGYTVETSSPLLGGHFGWQFIPSIEDMVYRLDCVYRMDSKANAEAGREWVTKNCSLDLVAAQWNDLLGHIETMQDEGRLKGAIQIDTTKVLELGAGNNPREADIHHDRIKHGPHIDVAYDLDNLPWPWKTEEFTHVIGYDVFEHLTLEPQDWLDEVWRILKVNGTLEMRLPAWDNPLSYRDPTHHKVYHEESFFYWDPRTNLYKDFGSYYFAESNKWWHVVSVEREANDLVFMMQKIV